MTPHLLSVGHWVAGLRWDHLDRPTRQRARLVVLDTLGCALAGLQAGAPARFVESMLASGDGDSTVWFANRRLPAAQAALVNGCVAHHVEMDDGNPRASLHGGVTIVPAALAVAEQEGRGGRDVLTAIAAGYAAAVAFGRPLLPGLTTHRLHPPAIVGCFGAAAATAHLLGLSGVETAGALSLAGSLLPIAPFETFTKGAPAKDLYGGWPAHIGVLTSRMALDGLGGPVDAFVAPDDGIARAVLHGVPGDLQPPIATEMLHVQFKPYATCRSVQPALAALEPLLPLDPASIASVDVATYPFAVELSQDADLTTPIGAKTSIPYCIATLVTSGAVGPESFAAAALQDVARTALAGRVTVTMAADMVEPLVRGARVTVRFLDGGERSHAVPEARWSVSNGATDDEIVTKFRRLAGTKADAIERAVERIDDAPDLSDLVEAIR